MSARFVSSDGLTEVDVVRMSRLELRVGYPAHDPDPDFVGVRILVDGKDLLARPGRYGPYRGPWPPTLLGDESPLIPTRRAGSCCTWSRRRRTRTMATSPRSSVTLTGTWSGLTSGNAATTRP